MHGSHCRQSAERCTFPLCSTTIVEKRAVDSARARRHFHHTGMMWVPILFA